LRAGGRWGPDGPRPARRVRARATHRRYAAADGGRAAHGDRGADGEGASAARNERWSAAAPARAATQRRGAASSDRSACGDHVAGVPSSPPGIDATPYIAAATPADAAPTR